MKVAFDVMSELWAYVDEKASPDNDIAKTYSMTFANFQNKFG